MKKIGVITFHSAENSGAALQCLALQIELKKLGADPYVIDYTPEYVLKQYRVIINPFLEARNRKVRGITYLKTIAAFTLQNICCYKKISRKNKFKKFQKRYFTYSKNYSCYDDILNDPPKADVYICGSDQIWNASLTGGYLDKAFFLNFGSENTEKYSYAVSIGKNLEENEYQDIYDYSKDLLKISFRESSLANSFSNRYMERTFYNCIDPTLLLSADDWYKFVKERKIKNKYILVYALEKNSVYDKLLEQVVTILGNASIVDISQCNLHLTLPSKRKMDFAPDEFLNYIYYAEFVLTNSFHCTVFSMIFQKNFYTIPHSKSSSRMIDLLTNVGLIDRLYTGKEFTENVDYSQFGENLMAYSKKSIDYLNDIVWKDKNGKL